MMFGLARCSLQTLERAYVRSMSKSIGEGGMRYRHLENVTSSMVATGPKKAVVLSEQETQPIPEPESKLKHLRTPFFAVDVDICQANAKRMLKLCKKRNIQLRPHVKTHKSFQGALMQTGGKRKCVTVSTIAEAKYLKKHGFEDILYAIPLTKDKIPDAAYLTETLESFHICIDSHLQMPALLSQVTKPKNKKQWSIWIMLDCGYGREGLNPESEDFLDIISKIDQCRHTKLGGLYTHGGHSYDCTSSEEITKIAEQERDCILRAAALLEDRGFPRPKTSIGSTPTCTHPPEDLEGISELHPGNYLFHDVMQTHIGTCSLADVAVSVYTRVLSHHVSSNSLLVDCGWMGCSMQGQAQGFGTFRDFPELRISNLKQEIGVITSVDDSHLDFNKYPVGSFLWFQPYHACAVTAMHQKIEVIDKGEHVDTWQIHKGW